MSVDAPGTDDRRALSRGGLLALGVIVAVAVPALLLVSVGGDERPHAAAWEYVDALRRGDARALELALDDLRAATSACLAGRCPGGATGDALNLLRTGRLEFGGTTGSGNGSRCFEATTHAERGGGSRSLRFHLVERGGRWQLDGLSTEGDCRD